MLEVHGAYVGELEDLLVGQLLAQHREHVVADPAAVIRDGIGVREHSALGAGVGVGGLPSRDVVDLRLVSVQSPQGLYVLGEHELAADRPADAALRQFAQHTVELAVRAAVQHEPRHGVFHDVGGQGIGGPPVALAACCCAHLLLGERVDALSEQQVVHSVDDGVVGLRTGDLSQPRHQFPPAWDAAAMAVDADLASWRTSLSSNTFVQAASSNRIPSGSWK